MSGPTEFSTTKKTCESSAAESQTLLLSEWAQRAREKVGKLSIWLSPNHMFAIPSKTLSLQNPSPPQPQLELPDFLRFGYS